MSCAFLAKGPCSSLYITIFFAIVGQIYGAKWRQKNMTSAEREDLEQIPHLDDKVSQNIKDSEVMVALLNMGGPNTNTDVRDFQKRLFSDSL